MKMAYVVKHSRGKLKFVIANSLEEAKYVAAGKDTDPKEWSSVGAVPVGAFLKREKFYRNSYGEKRES